MNILCRSVAAALSAVMIYFANVHQPEISKHLPISIDSEFTLAAPVFNQSPYYWEKTEFSADELLTIWAVLNDMRKADKPEEDKPLWGWSMGPSIFIHNEDYPIVLRLSIQKDGFIAAAYADEAEPLWFTGSAEVYRKLNILIHDEALRRGVSALNP